MEGERKALHKAYHDKQYGFPLHDDNELFGRLLLEINQAGLSWETMLKKEANFRKAYSGFVIAKVAKYGERERKRLLGDAGIIRNALKVNAAIENAKTILVLQKTHGSFEAWLLRRASEVAASSGRSSSRRRFVSPAARSCGRSCSASTSAPGAHDDDQSPIAKRSLKAEADVESLIASHVKVVEIDGLVEVVDGLTEPEDLERNACPGPLQKRRTAPEMDTVEPPSTLSIVKSMSDHVFVGSWGNAIKSA